MIFVRENVRLYSKQRRLPYIFKAILDFGWIIEALGSCRFVFKLFTTRFWHSILFGFGLDRFSLCIPDWP